MNSIRSFFAIVIALIITGCTNTAKDTHYLKSVHVSNQIKAGTEVSGYAVDAKQRFVWLPKRIIVDPVNGGKPVERTIICAEPSPDALSAMSANFSSSLSLSKGETSVNAALMKSFTESAEKIGVRSASIQLLRDALYRACEGYANGVLDDFGYSLIIGQMDNLMKELFAIQALEHSGVVADDNEVIENAIKKRIIADGKRHEWNVVGQQHRDWQAKIAEAERKKKTASDNLAKATDDNVKNSLIREEIWQQSVLDKLKDNKPDVNAAQKAYLEANAEAASLEALAATAKRSRSPSSISAIKAISTRTHSMGTAASACLMWLAKHPEIKVSQLSRNNANIPAIAKYCADTIATFQKNTNEYFKHKRKMDLIRYRRRT